MLPEGIGVTHTCLSVQRGTLDEFKKVIQDYEDKVAELAKTGVDAVNPSGAPPFMVLGYAGEQNLIRDWRHKYKVPIFTSGSSHVDALRALGARRFVGATYLRGDINKTYAKYFVDAGFDVLDMAGMDVDFEGAGADERTGLRLRQRRLPCEPHSRSDLHARSGLARLRHHRKLESDLGVPVVHALPAQCWDIQRHLKVRIPVKGFGRLAAEIP